MDGRGDPVDAQTAEFAERIPVAAARTNSARMSSGSSDDDVGDDVDSGRNSRRVSILACRTLVVGFVTICSSSTHIWSTWLSAVTIERTVRVRVRCR